MRTSLWRTNPRRAAVVLAVTAIVGGSWLSALPGAQPVSVAAAAAGDPVLAVGGDIACSPGKTVTATNCGQGKTGALLASINPNYVLQLGDSQYDTGSAAEYAGSYNTTGWGTNKSISRPAAGNHEYRTTGATDYYGYFGTNAGDPSKGYYSWDVAGPTNSFRWHLIALNSECSVLGGGSITAGCGAGSTQEAWLKADLAANPNVCTLAYWHRPRFSSSTTTPSSTTYTAFWNDLYNAGADVVLNGHAHNYERFNPQTSGGVADSAKGLREFVVGTGGDDFQTLGPPITNSAIANASAFGVMKLTLHANTYDWQFVAASGYALTDAGSASCHTAPAADTTPPSAPTNVTGTASSPNQVNLSWTASTDNVGVANYNIYRGSNGSTPSLIATTTTNASSFIDTSVTASTTYTYQVEAVDAAGNKSTMSATSPGITTPASADTTPPTTPSGLAAEQVFYNEIDLGWTGSTDSGTGVSGYKIYRKGPGEATYILLATTTGIGAGHNSYVDSTVKPNSAYSYQVSAYDGANNESGRATVTVATPAGPSSQTYTFTASGDATIQQGAPTSTGGGTSPLVIDNSPVEDALLEFNVATTGCDTLTSAKLSLTNNADGSSKGGDFYTTGPFTESTVTWATAPTRGTLLNSLGTVADNASVAVDVTQGTPLNGKADFRIGTTSTNGVHYFSREGTGAKPSLTVVCSAAQVPDNTAPSVPAGLRSIGNTAGEVDLAWDASTDNIAVTEYHIYRAGTQIGIVPANSLTYQDTTVAPSSTYSYTVRAFDAAGNSSGDSNAVSVTTPAGNPAPAAPSNLIATPSSDSVVLSWTASSSPSVSGYNIYRGPHGAALTKISSSGGSPFTDTPVAAGTYDYAVTAVATGSPESAQSNIATATVAGVGLSAPNGLSATATSATSVHLTWTASTGATSCNIYRGPHSGTLAKISSATTTAADDPSVAPSTGYDYAVTAVSSTAESPQSAVATVTTPASGGGGGGGITAGTAKLTQITTAATTWSVNLPAFVAGNFVVLWLGNNVGSTAGTPASTGWTSQLMINESSGLKGTFLTRRMVAGDPPAITVTFTAATLGVAEATAFTGVNTTTPVEVKGGQAEASSTAVASHATPSVTTTTANDVLVAGFTTDNAATWTAAGGTELADAAAGSVSAALYYFAPVTAGPHSATGAATIASVKAVSGLLALRP